MSSIYVPTKGTSSWRELLADPEKHTEGLFTTSWYSNYNVQKQKLTQLMQQWEEKHAQLEVADAEIKAFLNE